MKRTGTSDLSQFLAGYFHQDWHIDDPDTAAVITRFLSDAPTKAEIDRIISQIADYLGTSSDDKVLEAGLLDLNCYYLPSADGLTTRAWLNGISTRLKQD